MAQAGPPIDCRGNILEETHAFFVVVLGPSTFATSLLLLLLSVEDMYSLSGN
jgi:hypothetical protein